MNGTWFHLLSPRSPVQSAVDRVNFSVLIRLFSGRLHRICWQFFTYWYIVSSIVIACFDAVTILGMTLFPFSLLSLFYLLVATRMVRKDYATRCRLWSIGCCAILRGRLIGDSVTNGMFSNVASQMADICKVQVRLGQQTPDIVEVRFIVFGALILNMQKYGLFSIHKVCTLFRMSGCWHWDTVLLWCLKLCMKNGETLWNVGPFVWMSTHTGE